MFWCKYILVKYWNVLAIIKMLNFSIVEKLWGKKMTEWQLWTKSRDDFMTKIMLTQTSLHKINSQTDFSMYVIIFDLSNACKKLEKFLWRRYESNRIETIVRYRIPISAPQHIRRIESCHIRLIWRLGTATDYSLFYSRRNK